MGRRLPLVGGLIVLGLLARPGAPALAETLPDYFFGTAAVPPNLHNNEVLSRFITPQSLVFLTVDTTNWPGSDLALPGVKVNNHGKGFFTVTTLDNSSASSGVPFNYVVFNSRKTGPYTLGQGTVPRGHPNVGITDSAVTANSIILLTVDISTIPGDAVVPGLKVNNHGAGFFTVTTLDLSTAATDIPFNYLVIDDPACFAACTGKVPTGSVNVGISSQDVNATAAVFLTVDATRAGTTDMALRGVKVNNRGAGFFTVTTDRLVRSGSSGVPFNYVVFNPPPRWEELGPAAQSGKIWSIAADPRDWRTLYIAATGVWKSTDGGDSWTQAWDTQAAGGARAPLRDQLIMQVKFLPGSPSTLYALGFDGTVFKSTDAAVTWTRLAVPAPIVESPTKGAVLAVSEYDVKLVCSAAGLYASADGRTWSLLEPSPGPTPHPCTDVVALPGGNRLAAFRDIGVWSWDLVVGWASSALLPQQGADGAPIRVAVSGGTIVVNDDGDVWVSVNGGAFRNRLRNGAHVAASGQEGYSLSVAISPTDPNHFIAASSGAYMTFDAGASWPIPDPAIRCQDPPVVCPQLSVGQDDHELSFWSDSVVVMATDKGPRISTDRGVHWRDADTNEHVTKGPQLGEIYRWFSISSPDQFGRVLVGGAAQDLGGMFVAGNRAGFGCCSGEIGVVAISPRPSDARSTNSTTFRIYATNDIGDVLRVCNVRLPGPDYITPQGLDAGDFPSDGPGLCEDVNPKPFPGSIYQALVHPTNPDLAVAATFDGKLYRSIAGSGGKRWQRLPISTPTMATDGPALALWFDPSGALYAGYDSGRILRVQEPFGAAPRVTANAQPRNVPGTRVAAIVGRRPAGGPTEVYAAFSEQILRSIDDGATWSDITDPRIAADVGAGTEIVGLALDPAYPFLYAATGHFEWLNRFGGTPHVWRTAIRPQGSYVWFDLSQGLPEGARITNIKSSPNVGLYISTFGRGIWWRRDVAAVPPLSGVNRPDDGAVAIGARQDFVTTCSYPTGWKHIHTLDFKLAMGLGPEEGQPVALWVEYVQERNVMRFYDPDSDTWSEGTPGSAGVLTSRFARLDLAQSAAHGLGPMDPTVELTWSVTLLQPASEGPLQQYLQVTDDLGNTTSWDRVGSFNVDPSLQPPQPPRSASSGSGSKCGCSAARQDGPFPKSLGTLALLAAVMMLWRCRAPRACCRTSAG